MPLPLPLPLRLISIDVDIYGTVRRYDLGVWTAVFWADGLWGLVMGKRRRRYGRRISAMLELWMIECGWWAMRWSVPELSSQSVWHLLERGVAWRFCRGWRMASCREGGMAPWGSCEMGHCVVQWVERQASPVEKWCARIQWQIVAQS